MIARTWSAITSQEKEAGYLKTVRSLVLPHFDEAQGFKGSLFLKQSHDDGWKYVVITFWESLDAAYALSNGQDPKVAYIPDEISDTLNEFDKTVEYYESVIEHGVQFQQ